MRERANGLVEVSSTKVPFRKVPFRKVPFRKVPFRRVPFRKVPFRKVPFRFVSFRFVSQSTVSRSAELTCANCGRIEILDGTAFAMRKHTTHIQRQENTLSNIDFISFSIVAVILQNYILPKSRKRAIFSNI